MKQVWAVLISMILTTFGIVVRNLRKKIEIDPTRPRILTD